MDIKAELRNSDAEIRKARNDMMWATMDNIKSAVDTKEQILSAIDGFLLSLIPPDEVDNVTQKKAQELHKTAESMFTQIKKDYDKKVSESLKILQPTGAGVPVQDRNFLSDTAYKKLYVVFPVSSAGLSGSSMFNGLSAVPVWVIDLAFMIPGVKESVAKVISDLYMATAKALDPEIQVYIDSIKRNGEILQRQLDNLYTPGMLKLQDALQYLSDKTTDTMNKILSGTVNTVHPRTITDNTNVTEDVDITVPGLPYRLTKKIVTPQGISYEKEALTNPAQTMNGNDYYIRYH